MKPRLCVAGDYRAAVKAPRSSDFCRDCYREQILRDVALLKCEVIGAAPITDARTQESVNPGGVVELDEAESNIAALVAAGSIKVLAPAKAPAKKD
jgi:hypothetical protein